MSDTPGHRPELRISDLDRDRAAEVLREAHAHGRITVEELDERLTSVYAAKTHADLVPITRDLPAVQDAAAPPRNARSSRIGVAVMGGIEVKRAPARRPRRTELPSSS
jgi:Domain of unknown function (DUF1707)